MRREPSMHRLVRDEAERLNGRRAMFGDVHEQGRHVGIAWCQIHRRTEGPCLVNGERQQEVKRLTRHRASPFLTANCQYL